MTESGLKSRVDLDAAGGVDPARLERSLRLDAQRIGRGRYLVWGGSEPHWVDLYTRKLPRCDCGDHLWRDRVCKHILAAMHREGDDRIIEAVGSLVASLRGEPHRGRSVGRKPETVARERAA